MVQLLRTLFTLFHLVFTLTSCVKKVKVKLLSRVRLFATQWDYSLQNSSIRRILQARILEWVAISFSRGSSRPRDRTRIVGRHFTI